MSNDRYVSGSEKRFAGELAASGLPTCEYPADPLDEANALRGTSSSGNPPPSTFGPVGLGYPPWNLHQAAVPLPFAPVPPQHTSHQAAPSSALPPHQPQPAPTSARQRAVYTNMLTNLPEVREIPWRQGQDATSNKMRSAQLYAMELVVKGDIAPVPCTQCAAGMGKFSLCVVRAGEIGGACEYFLPFVVVGLVGGSCSVGLC